MPSGTVRGTIYVQPSAWQLEQQSFPCGHCEALPNDPCLLPGGGRTHMPHRSRFDQASAARAARLPNVQARQRRR
jgi:hypothetical protein